MSETKFIPALGYDFLSDYYDLAIKVTMPEKKFRNRLIDFVDPKEKEKNFRIWFRNSPKHYHTQTTIS